MSAVEKFMPLVLEAEDLDQVPSPVTCTDDGINFLYIKHNNLYCTAFYFHV
jgi:AP-1 complex subunit mu